MRSSVEGALLVKIHPLINKANHLEGISIMTSFPESLLAASGRFFLI